MKRIVNATAKPEHERRLAASSTRSTLGFAAIDRRDHRRDDQQQVDDQDLGEQIAPSHRPKYRHLGAAIPTESGQKGLPPRPNRG